LRASIFWICARKDSMADEAASAPKQRGYRRRGAQVAKDLSTIQSTVLKKGMRFDPAGRERAE
jgi:hypothetical protein